MPESPEDKKARLFRRFVEQASTWSDRLMLSRMRKHGYWPKHVNPPPDPRSAGQSSRSCVTCNAKAASWRPFGPNANADGTRARNAVPGAKPNGPSKPADVATTGNGPATPTPPSSATG